jgi:hypothetical protein
VASGYLGIEKAIGYTPYAAIAAATAGSWQLAGAVII